jgi:hypothetical protein
MMSDTEHSRVLTEGLWSESEAGWRALAKALRARGLEPKQVAVGDRFSDDPDKDFGVLLTKDGDELSFVLQFLGKGRVAAAVNSLLDPGIYADALDAAQAVLDSRTDS